MNGIELDSGMMKIVLPRAFDASNAGPGWTNAGICLYVFTRFATTAGTAAEAAATSVSAAAAAASAAGSAARGRRGVPFMSTSRLGGTGGA